LAFGLTSWRRFSSCQSMKQGIQAALPQFYRNYLESSGGASKGKVLVESRETIVIRPDGLPTIVR
jgi:hypothetical protein